MLLPPPAQLLVLLVKADTIDVNVAGSLRFTQQDWAAAAEVFEQELAGVQLVDEQQVSHFTLVGQCTFLLAARKGACTSAQASNCFEVGACVWHAWTVVFGARDNKLWVRVQMA